MTCKAKQYSDTMVCECGLVWDTNDIYPPECTEVARLRKIRESIAKGQKNQAPLHLISTLILSGAILIGYMIWLVLE